MHFMASTMQLYLPSRTLKEKRSIIKSILTRARNMYNVAAAEVDFHDAHDTALLAFVTVSENHVVARHVLERIEEWVVNERPDLEVVSMEIEEL
jgi:uncharacterized protein YlxP (DUF503 family)